MFGAGDHAFFLNAFGKGRAELPQQERVFAVGFLRASPAGITHQVDADARKVICPLRDCLTGDGFSYAVFQALIKRGGPQHGHRKTG